MDIPFKYVQELLSELFTTVMKDINQKASIEDDDILLKDQEGQFLAKVKPMFLTIIGQSMVSLLRIHPSSEYYVEKEFENWDLCSMWGISRHIYESYLLFHYLTYEEIDKDELRARKLLYLFHDQNDRITALNIRPYDRFSKDHIPQLQKHADEILQKLEATSYNKKVKEMLLTRDYKKILEKGRYHTRQQMIDEVKLKPVPQKEFYIISSWYVHLKAQALSHYTANEKGIEWLVNKCYTTAAFFLYLSYSHYLKISKRIVTLNIESVTSFENVAQQWVLR